MKAKISSKPQVVSSKSFSPFLLTPYAVLSLSKYTFLTFCIFLFAFCILPCGKAAAQGVAINTTGTAADASAMLDVTSTTQGLLIPRMTLAQRNAIASPANSLLVYQTDGTPGYYYYNGTAWVSLFSNNSGWSLTGNAGTSVGTNFLGTTDAQDFAIYTNNAERIRVLSGGNVGIGTTAPTAKFQIETQGLSRELIFGTINGLLLKNQTTNTRTIFGIAPNGTDQNADLVIFHNSDYTTNFEDLSFGYDNTQNHFHIGVSKGGTGTQRRLVLDATGTASDSWKQLVLATSGNVGIGTTNPLTSGLKGLHIASSINTIPAYFRLENDLGTSANIWIGASANINQNGNLLIQQNTSKNIFIDSEIKGTTVIGAETVANNSNRFEVIGQSYFSGNVGIGTISPNGKMTLSGDGNSPNTLRLVWKDETGAANQKFTYIESFDGNLYFNRIDDDFSSNNLNRLTILNSGNIGIGTTNPTRGTLDIRTSGISILALRGQGEGEFQDHIEFYMNPGQGANAREGVMYTNTRGTNGFGFMNQGVAPIWFGTLNTERLRITSGGNVGIGTTAPTALLSVNGAANNTTGVWGVFSDRRLKRDIEPLQGALSKILQLQGVSFCWKDSAQNAQLGRVRGFIAQDVEKVIPEWVKTTSNGFKQLETIGMDAMLVEAIKEQQQQIETLQSENSKVQNENQSLKAEIIKQQTLNIKQETLNNELRTEIEMLKRIVGISAEAKK